VVLYSMFGALIWWFIRLLRGKRKASTVFPI
jgi:hypothetical protein